MTTTKIQRAVFFVIILTTIGLTGCFKGEISVDVKPNGSGVINIAIGMTQQAKARIASQGTDLFQDMEKAVADGSGSTNGVTLTSWIDGDYEWKKAEKEFDTVEEIRKSLNGKELFNRFSLTQSRGIIRNEFVLDAEFAPLNSGPSSSNELGVDPASIIQMSFSARLPGKIVETNGLVDINDPNRIVWTMQSNQSVFIRARSTSWNWLNILAITGILLLLGIVLIAGLAHYFYVPSDKNKQMKTSKGIVTPSIQETGRIADLYIENLLSQLNTNILRSVGKIHKKQGEISLIWTDTGNVERNITVKELKNNNISVNDQVYIATTEDIRTGIIHALKNQGF